MIFIPSSLVFYFLGVKSKIDLGVKYTNVFCFSEEFGKEGKKYIALIWFDRAAVAVFIEFTWIRVVFLCLEYAVALYLIKYKFLEIINSDLCQDKDYPFVSYNEFESYNEVVLENKYRLKKKRIWSATSLG